MMSSNDRTLLPRWILIAVLGALALLLNGEPSSMERAGSPDEPFLDVTIDGSPATPLTSSRRATGTGGRDVADPPAQPDEADPSDAIDPRTKMSRDLIALLDSDDVEEPFRVIVQTASHEDDESPREALRRFTEHRGLSESHQFALLPASVIEMTRDELMEMARFSAVSRLSLDAPIRANLGVAAKAIGADQVWSDPHSRNGFDGRNVGVAVIDSGGEADHEDFIGKRDARMDENDLISRRNRIRADGYGHGIHVAGIVGSDASASSREHKGIAPKATLITYRVLDRNGVGYTSDVIRAIETAIAEKADHNIRVINLSLGHPVYESYLTDPLTLACGLAVEAGIAVVASAGNNGNADGQPLYGGINSPANAPWVIAVGATKTQRTVRRSDDEVASYSSRGPTPIDGLIKPDLVAPGDRIVSCQVEDTYLSRNYPELTLNGTRDSNSTEVRYMRLSGTSMAAPMVSGTLALVFEANPSLSVSAAKAILLYTAEKMTEPDLLSQGSGYLNTEGAVRLAQAIRQDSDGLDMGAFWLDADGPENAAGLLEPRSEIGGETVPWGAAFHWGDSVVRGGGVLWNFSVLWGNGIIWTNGILWTNGEPWFDDLMAYNHPAYTDGILWSFTNMGENQDVVLWADAILWSFDSIDQNDIVLSDGILWTHTELFETWSNSFVDPESISGMSSGNSVLTSGEAADAGPYELIDSSSAYFPR